MAKTKNDDAKSDSVGFSGRESKSRMKKRTGEKYRFAKELLWEWILQNREDISHHGLPSPVTIADKVTTPEVKIKDGPIKQAELVFVGEGILTKPEFGGEKFYLAPHLRDFRIGRIYGRQMATYRLLVELTRAWELATLSKSQTEKDEVLEGMASCWNDMDSNWKKVQKNPTLFDELVKPFYDDDTNWHKAMFSKSEFEDPAVLFLDRFRREQQLIRLSSPGGSILSLNEMTRILEEHKNIWEKIGQIKLGSRDLKQMRELQDVIGVHLDHAIEQLLDVHEKLQRPFP